MPRHGTIGYMGPSERVVFDLSLGEMLVIAVLVIVFVGPDGLPDLMRVLGRLYGQVRRASDDLRRTFNAEVARVDADRRREELRQRREARERQRGPVNGPDGAVPNGAADGTQARASRPRPPRPDIGADPDVDEDDPALMPADPRLPPDAAPRFVPPRTAPRPPPVAPPPKDGASPPVVDPAAPPEPPEH